MSRFQRVRPWWRRHCVEVEFWTLRDEGFSDQLVLDIAKVSRDLGHKQSENDKCLFINPKTQVIILTCVDDCLFFAPTKEAIDEVIAAIQRKLDLEEQHADRDAFEWLGIEVNMEGNVVEFLQEGLTEKILRAVGLDECNANLTPAKESPLTSDLDGDPFNEEWDYASVVGMLMWHMHARTSNSRFINVLSTPIIQWRVMHMQSRKSAGTYKVPESGSAF